MPGHARDAEAGAGGRPPPSPPDSSWSTGPAGSELAGLTRSDVVARISHELRTPLTGLLTAVELLGHTGPTEEQQQLITILARSGQRLATLLDHVLDVVDVDVGAGAAANQRVLVELDLHATLRDVVALAETAARAKDVAVVLHLADDVPRRIRDHPTWTSQILDNLLANAVTHTDGGTVELSVTLAGDPARPCLVYRVSDTGTGIDPAHHDLVFEPFAQAPPAPGRPRRTGTGLGLNIVRDLVSLSSGSISLDSEPGRGSTFWVSMPVERVDPPR